MNLINKRACVKIIKSSQAFCIYHNGIISVTKIAYMYFTIINYTVKFKQNIAMHL